MQTLNKEQQQALAARLRYYRDLGVYDFYRRGEPSANAEIVMSSGVTIPEIIPDTILEASTPAASPAREAVPITIEEEMPRRPSVPIAVPPVFSSAPVAASQRASALQAIRDEIGDCTRCPLAFGGRHSIVFGEGDPNTRLLFVGEGPGADEDASGRPFVGRAGQLLNNMISAMGLKREEVYIANIVKCRPPQNRTPEPVEANTCSPFLFQQINVIRPEVMVALGSTAATYLLGAKSSLASLRGRVHQAHGSKLIVTYHPAYLLRDPRQKKEAWADLQIAMSELGLKAPAKSAD